MADENPQGTGTEQAPSSPTVPAVTTAKAPAPPAVESTYTRAEILDAASSFGATRHLVAGALHGSTKSEFTHSEVETLINAYKTKEV